jgi:hypothetical protein
MERSRKGSPVRRIAISLIALYAILPQGLLAPPGPGLYRHDPGLSLAFVVFTNRVLGELQLSSFAPSFTTG